MHPGLAKKKSFVIRKEIKQPPLSVELAELLGIMLGDGGIRSKYQFTVSYNNKTDRNYSRHVTRLIKRLFGIDHKILLRKEGFGADIVISSASVIEFLLAQGLKEGSKVRNQVDIPDEVNKKKYEYWKMNFTNRSRSLLNSVLDILLGLRIKAFLNGDNIYIHSQDGVKRYFEIIGSSNPKFLDKLKRV